MARLFKKNYIINIYFPSLFGFTIPCAHFAFFLQNIRKLIGYMQANGECTSIKYTSCKEVLFHNISNNLTIYYNAGDAWGFPPRQIIIR